MADIMKEIFGHKLVVKADNSDCLPSPEQLKEKILIKVFYFRSPCLGNSFDVEVLLCNNIVLHIKIFLGLTGQQLLIYA